MKMKEVKYKTMCIIYNKKYSNGRSAYCNDCKEENYPTNLSGVKLMVKKESEEYYKRFEDV